MSDSNDSNLEPGRLSDWLRKPPDSRETVRGSVAEAPPARLGPLRLSEADVPRRFVDLGEIGRGGTSTIRRVQDQNLQREVAMKVLDPEMARHAVARKAFVEEAQITGQLDHPNIVPVHDIGVDADGTTFFTMKLVRGLTLTEWVRYGADGDPPALTEALDVFIKICDAVSFAHSRGVIHRDIKPDNVMVGRFGEVYLMDWGIALLRTGASEPAECVVGTPAYMSPEQAAGDVGGIDERTDVFGLGAVLYEMVCGQHPYSGDTPAEAVARALEVRFVPPEEVNPTINVPPGIRRILGKAMSRAPADRHQSAAELKHDVQRLVRGGMHLPAQTFTPGARICVEGMPGDSAYLITRGRCSAYKTLQGQRRSIREMGPGAVFGEMAAISKQPRTATVEAITEVTALVVTRAMLEEGLGLDTWLGSFVKALADRFRELDESFAKLEKEVIQLRGANPPSTSR